MRNQVSSLALRLLLLWLSSTGVTAAQAAAPVRWWLTTRDMDHKLAEQTPLSLTPNQSPPIAGAAVIVVDDSQSFQTILGLGSSLEHATCFNLSQLADDRRTEVIERLFDPERGIGINLARICIGTPDFTGDPWYTYDDLPTGEVDPSLERFSIEKDRHYVLPILRQALAANPRLQFFASPWSPPGWMKSTGDMIGGHLMPEHYGAYAQYFVRFVLAYEAEGIPIRALTVQNEPGVDRSRDQPRWRYPSCRYTAEQERDFIKGHLGPALARAGLKTEIWTYDHNFNVEPTADGDDPGIAYPRAVLADAESARFVAGVAFHGYAGEPSGMSQFHREFPKLPMHFTEGSVFGPPGGRLLTEYLRNGASSHNGWVTMIDSAGQPNRGPFRASRTCVTLNRQTGEVDYHYDYYQYGHFFRHLRRGAVRIASAGGDAKLAHVAVRNPDGQIAVVVVNVDRQPRDVTLVWQQQTATTRLPGQSIATCTWSAEGSDSAYTAKGALELAGICVTPHLIASALRYARDPEPELGARVQLFVRNVGGETVTLEPALARISHQPSAARSPSPWLASSQSASRSSAYEQYASGRSPPCSLPVKHLTPLATKLVRNAG